ncbi:MAG: thioredoxin domain-containing protein [Gemmatimonadota bacterium]
MNKKSGKQKSRPARSKATSGGNRTFYLVLAGIAVLGAGGLLFAGGDSEAQSPVTPFSVADLTADADANAGVALGPDNAAVTVIEFSDFQCPHCRNFNGLTGRLLRQNYAGPEGPIRWISYDFPLNFTNSLTSALAGRCAEAQGQFWRMHDLLLARQDEWGRDSSPKDKFVRYAEETGLDSGEFEDCFDERRHLKEIVASRKYGEQLGVTGTPSLFLNGQKIQAGSYQGIERLIQEALAASSATAEAAEASGQETAE